jgi:hypothetical protein
VGGAHRRGGDRRGADIATAVPHEVLRALCIVSGGDCDRIARRATWHRRDASSWR